MRLDGGQVVVLPTTFEPGEEVAFTFRVFSKSSPGNLRMRVVDFTPAIVGSVFSRGMFKQVSKLQLKFLHFGIEHLCKLLMFDYSSWCRAPHQQ